MLILYFYIFQRGFEALKATFQAFVYVTIVTAIMICTTVRKIFNVS